MPIVLWDASGLVKRYAPEAGDRTVDAVFSAVSGQNMALTPWGYAETYSILLKARNGGIVAPLSFYAAYAKLQAEVPGVPGLKLLTVSDSAILGSLSLMQAHNINAADAAILAAYLRYQRARPPGSDPCLLVASDKRLSRAAEAEGRRRKG